MKLASIIAYFFINCSPTDRLLVVAPKNAFVAWDEQLDSCIKNNMDLNTLNCPGSLSFSVITSMRLQQ